MGIIWNVIVCILMSLPCVCGTEGERGGGRRKEKEEREREEKRQIIIIILTTHIIYTYL